MYWTQFLIETPEWSIDDLRLYMLDTKAKEHLVLTNIETCPDSSIIQAEEIKEGKRETIDNDNNTIKESQIINQTDSLRSFTQIGNCQDSLFWSLYVCKYGMKEYMRIGKHNGNEEMKEKQNVIEYMLKQDVKSISSLLNVKMTKVGCKKIAEDILTLPRIPMLCIHAFALYYNMCIYIIDQTKQIYISYTNETSDKSVILYKNPNKKQSSYFLDIDQSFQTITHITSRYFHIISHSKPLRAISTYKVSELEQIAVQLNISMEDKLKKQDLYNRIALHCVWE